MFSLNLTNKLRGEPSVSVQRFICRDCDYLFSDSIVEVNVAGKIFKSLDSGEYDHKVRVASGDTSNEKVDEGLPFFSGEDVSSHDNSIVEKSLNGLPFYNSKHRVCAQKYDRNSNATTETKNIKGAEKQTVKIKFAISILLQKT